MVKEGEFGNYLGQLMEELEGDSIRKFGKQVLIVMLSIKKKKRLALNVKGITQMHECCKRLNFKRKWRRRPCSP